MSEADSPRIAIIAALPREVRGLIGRIEPDPLLKKRGIYLYTAGRATVVCGGMGGSRVSLAVEAALARPGVRTLVSTGLAGACGEHVAVGQVVEAAVVVDSTSGERFHTNSSGVDGSGAVLVTAHAVAGVSEKRRLHQAYGAAIVDMEAASVGRLARAHGLEFRAIKAVSDAHDFELQSLGRFASAQGHFRTRAFALHTAFRPHTWGHTLRLGAASQRALSNLTIHLQQFLVNSAE